jgi:hypothetical protein
MDDNLEKAKNLKLLLCAFKQLLGLKINFYKSEIFCFSNAKNSEKLYSQLFGCQIRAYPFKYLGIPMHYKRLSNKDWKEIEHRIEKKLSSWKGKPLSVGGRLVLINSILTSMVLFMLSLLQKSILGLDSFGKMMIIRKKYRLAKCDILCQPKEQRGMKIMNVDIQNQCLLSK